MNNVRYLEELEQDLLDAVRFELRLQHLGGGLQTQRQKESTISGGLSSTPTSAVLSVHLRSFE